jgi:hypothetical protein
VARADRATLEFVESESRLPQEWLAASHIANKTVLVTPQEAEELVRRLEEIIRPYLRSVREKAPEEAEVLRLLLRLFPRDLPPG